MKKLIVAAVLTVVLITGCGKNSDDNLKKENIEEVVYNFQKEFEKCKEKDYVNLDLSECNAKITDVEKLCKLEIDEYAAENNVEKRIEDFEEYCEFFFENYDSLNIFFGSTTQNLEYDGGYWDYPRLNKYREQIISGEIQLGYLLYVDFENNNYLWEMEADYAPFWMNKGHVFPLVKDEGERVTSWKSTDMGNQVAKYYNDGTHDDVSFKLMDGEVTIGEAIDFVENKYLKSLPFDYGEEVSLEVLSVSVYEIQEEVFAYVFELSFGWNGIVFDSAAPFTSVEQVHNIFIMADALMAEKDEIDEFSGLGVPNVIGTEDLNGEVYTLESAIDIVSESLSQEVKFEVLTISMVYMGVYEVLTPEETKGSALPAWKFQLYNTNDGLYYNVYVDVLSGQINSFAYTLMEY